MKKKIILILSTVLILSCSVIAIAGNPGHHFVIVDNGGSHESHFTPSVVPGIPDSQRPHFIEPTN